MALQIADVAFWEELITKSKTPENEPSEHCSLPPLPDVESNVYSFGMLSLQIISGRLPHSKENGDLLNWVYIYIYRYRYRYEYANFRFVTNDDICNENIQQMMLY